MSEKMIHLSPADLVVYLLGGVRKTGRAIGRQASSVSKWKKPVEEGGCGGFVPGHARRLLLEYARSNGIELSSEDLDYGRKVKVVRRMVLP